MTLRMRVRVEGTAELARALRGRRQALIDGIDRDVETTTLTAINEARANSPYKTGNLRRQIQLITQDTKPMSRSWGGFAEYTARQEYEHRSKRGFMRRAQWNARANLRDAIQQTIQRLGGRL